MLPREKSIVELHFLHSYFWISILSHINGGRCVISHLNMAMQKSSKFWKLLQSCTNLSSKNDFFPNSIGDIGVLNFYAKLSYAIQMKKKIRDRVWLVYRLWQNVISGIVTIHVSTYKNVIWIRILQRYYYNVGKCWIKLSFTGS